MPEAERPAALLSQQERAVLCGIADTKPPYSDEIRQRTELPDTEFDQIVTELKSRGILGSFLGIRGGALLFPTERGKSLFDSVVMVDRG